MQVLLASVPAPLAIAGQIAAIVLLLFMLINILVGLALAAALLLGVSWVREKAALLKKLRPVVDSVNITTEAAIKGEQPLPIGNETRTEKIAHAAALVPKYTYTVEQKVEQGGDRVAGAVIEFRARTVMVTGTLKALFLPGLVNRAPSRRRLPAWQDIPVLEEEHGVDEAAKPLTEPPAIPAIESPAPPPARG
jgi:hypothetical protein